MTCGFDCELLLCAEPGPLSLDDARTMASGEFNRSIGLARVHDDNFVGKSHAREAMPQLRGGVACDEGYGKGHGQRKKSRQTRIISGLCAAF